MSQYMTECDDDDDEDHVWQIRLSLFLIRKHHKIFHQIRWRTLFVTKWVAYPESPVLTRTRSAISHWCRTPTVSSKMCRAM